MKMHIYLRGDVEHDFVKYMETIGETNKSGVASDLIALGLRVKNKNQDKPFISDRELLEEILSRTNLNLRLTKAVFVSTRPYPEPLPNIQLNAGFDLVHTNLLQSNDAVKRFLAGEFKEDV